MRSSETARDSDRSRQERWRRKAQRAFRSGDLNAAESACARLVELEPGHGEAWFIAAVCALERGQLGEASRRFARATELETDRAAYWAQHARCLELMGRQSEAKTCTDRALALPITDALTHDTLGNALVRLGRHAEAAGQFEAAARRAPRQPQFLYNLATALMYCGDLAGAETAYERVLEIDPDQARAHLALAEMLERPPPPDRIERLEAALGRASGDIDRELVLRQALARTLEAAGDTTLALAQWEQGKSAKKAAVGYTIEQDRTIFSAFERVFSVEAAADPRPGVFSAAPIFVLGMPRSGTTLAERILSSHSAVTSAGEITHFALGIKQAGGSRNGLLIDPESLAPALAMDPATIGARYLERARTIVGDAGRFVDKLPLNFFFVGFIRRALPKAKIVCLRRGALDTCLANFRQLFALGFPHYRYALSLADTAEYFALFEKLMAHWDALYPGAVHHLQYEALVADPEPEIRRLFDYVGLDFEPEVLRFDRNDAPVATASAVQVRRPIYQDSVGAWRRYERELAPLRRRLEELGVAC